MTTWREARAAKTERLRREARHYTPDLIGKPCNVCGHGIPLALEQVGETTHPMCASVERGIGR